MALPVMKELFNPPDTDSVPHLHPIARENKEPVLEEVHKMTLDRSYLWYAKFLNYTPDGKKCYLPKLFRKWFPCENITEPLGWNIGTHSERLYMTEVSVPESVGAQTITMTGISDNIDKEVEMWLLRWYNSFHFRENVSSSSTRSDSFFHHAATLSEFSRILSIVRLTPKRNIAFTVTYYVTPRSDMPLTLNYTSSPKKIDALNLDIHGKLIDDRQEYMDKYFHSLFAL